MTLQAEAVQTADITTRFPDSCVIQLTEAQRAALPWRRPKGEPQVASQPATPGAGHNSGNAPSWSTPSKLTFNEAAKLSVGKGRYAHERRALIEMILDPRLGICPLPVQLYAAVIECINGETGMAHPGSRYAAQRILSYLNGIPAQYREAALWNAATLVRQCGYGVSDKRAPEQGGRAITHWAITCPSPEEKQAAVEAWCREKQATRSAKPDLTRTVTSGSDLTRGMRSPDLTRGVRSEGLTSPVDEVCPHPAGEKTGPSLYTEPGKRNPKKESKTPPDGGVHAQAREPSTRTKKASKPESSLTAIPEGALLVGKFLEEALRIGLTEEQAHDEWACMVDWANGANKTGKVIKRESWGGTWRNWCRRFLKERGQKRSNGSRSKGNTGAVFGGIAKFMEGLK